MLRDHRRLSARLQLLSLEDRTVASVVYSAPVTISAGGTYTGNWESLNPNVPAVRITTSAPVVLQGCHIRGRSTLISSTVQNGNVTIRNCYGYGLNPNVAGESAGRFADIEFFSNVVIENNYLENTGGIWLLEYRGNHTAANSVKVLRNRAHNIDGRKSDGLGGYLDYNERTVNGVTQEGYECRQFFQMDKVLDVPNMEIAWNEVVNDPGQSRVEDNINIYQSRGTPTSHLLIHDNYINGAYTIQPGQASYSNATGSFDWGFSGGGILLGDGDTTNPALVPAYADVYNNHVLNTTNYGVSIAGGHDQRIYNNRVISCGFLSDGTFVTAQNVGAYIWDSYGLGSGIFYNNSGFGNQSGFVNQPTGARNDWWVPDASSWQNNVHWSGVVTTATELAEYGVWQSKLITNVVTIGPPAIIDSIVVNDNSAQRSRVTSLTIRFEQPVSLPPNPADAFTLERQSPAGAVALVASVNGNVVTLTFTGGPVDGASLADGRYTLTCRAGQINGGFFDGNGNGVSGDDYVLIGNPATNKLFRLFGDADGNGAVNSVDFISFLSASNNGPSSIFDVDGDGNVSQTDFIQFRNRFNLLP